MSDDDDCQIIESNTNYKSITCDRIPELFLDKLIAKKHFGKYGKISRFILRPNRFCCTVDYEREEDATNALRNGSIFNGHEFDIRYSLHEVGHVQNTEEWVDPDVQAELDIMGNHTRRMPAPPPKIPPPPSQSMSAPRTAFRQKMPKSHNPEPAPTPAPHRVVPNSVRIELEAIIAKPASNDEDKYRILDARDKLIRLTTVRTTDIKKVVSIKGTCPDMCPEKERFMREFQHQVSGFEMEEGGSRNEMNHNIAIKEYSRSSADQEVPLAHELRPESTLKMTMQYLMHRIMGLCDIAELNIGDWFHFVWDRTRSIRKDITQQELCSTGAVELVEQCARFHIHCAARLVAEDPSVFDQKINTENLTKCLQTLKYMYNDLRIKDIRCQNEAEFRGFIVLLNLNDANFLWELQDLPEEIQNSNEVRSAIAFYKCLESNNYVRFFNLVRKTSYMNACILLRYFTQVRLKATRMIIKAYNWPRHSVSLPLGHLVKILGFENEDAALDFFSYYGLQCDVETVRLDKKAFEQPDVPVIMDRAFEIVESKRQVGVGEAVCGSPLDSPSIFENHQLHDSFDANGYLRYESMFAQDQLKSGGVSKTSQPTMVDKVFKIPNASPPMTPKQKLKAMFSNTSPKEDVDFKPLATIPPFKPLQTSLQPVSKVSESIFNQNSFNPPANNSLSSSIFKIPMPAPPVQAPNAPSSSIFGSASSFQSSSDKKGSIFGGSNTDPEPPKTSTTNIFGSSTQSFASDSIFQHFNSKPLHFDVIEPQIDKQHEMRKKQEEEERLRQQREQEERRRKEIEELERKRQILEEQKSQKRLEEQYRREAIEEVAKNSQRLLIQLLEEVLDEQLEELASTELVNHQCLEKLAENIISDYILEYIQQIHNNELTIMRRDQSLLSRYFHTWHELVHKRKTQRELIATFPIWMTTDTLDEQAKKMAHPRQTENLQMIKRYRLGLPCDFRALLGDDDTNTPIDMFSCLMRHFEESQNQLPTGFLKRRKYFKLLISLPGEREELPGFNSYASNWLDKNVKRKSTDSTPDAFVCSCEGDLALCVRKVSGIIPMNEENQKVRKECDHAGGLLFMMAPGNLRNSRKRLHHLLKLSRIHQAIPVAVIIYSTSSVGAVESDLEVESLMKNGKISSFHVFHSNDYNMKVEFQKSLRFIAKNETDSCPLEAQSIEGFLNTCLGDELWQKLHKSWAVNPSFRKICSTPKFLIRIYNSGIQSLIKVIDEDFQDYPEFPQELRQFVPFAKFDIPVGLEQFPDDWKNINRVRKLISFLGRLKLPSPPKEEIPLEIDDLELWLLNYTSACIPNNDDLSTKAGYNAIKCLIEELNNESLQDLPLDQRFNWISWLPILRQIAIAVMNKQWMASSKRLPREVIYNRNEFMEFQSEPWWLKSESVKSVKMMTVEDDEIPNDEEESQFDIDSIIARAEKASSLADDKLKRLHKEATETTTDPELTRELDETFYNFEVNEKCRSFEGTNTVNIDEEEDSLDIPPLAKKFKENSERDEMESTMERAFAILKKTESIMDRYLKPLQQIQSLEENYV